MSRFNPLPILGSSKRIDTPDPYWHFDFPTVVKENGNATHVEFSPVDPHDLLGKFKEVIFQKKVYPLKSLENKKRSVSLI